MGKHIGKRIVEILTERIILNTDATKIIVKPDNDNIVSRKTLLSANYNYDKERDLYMKNIEQKIRLVRPTIDDKNEAIAFKQAFFDYGEKVIDGSELLDRKQTYEEWFAYVDRIKDLKECEVKAVATDTYFALDENNNIVGIIDFRHELNDFFKDFGHCGYSVLPSERRKGYATEMLHLICLRAKECGLKVIQLSALRNNIGSVKTIVNNGGKVIRSFNVEDNIADVFEIEL